MKMMKAEDRQRSRSPQNKEGRKRSRSRTSKEDRTSAKKEKEETKEQETPLHRELRTRPAPKIKVEHSEDVERKVKRKDEIAHRPVAPDWINIGDYSGAVIENGIVDFFFRPKVMLKKAHGIEDVQRFYILLRPSKIEGIEGPYSSRLLLMGAKTLPTPRGSIAQSLHWAFVYKVGSTKELMSHLEEKDYETKTCGDRHVERARPAGRGLYEFVHIKQEGRPYKRGTGTTKGKEHCVFAYVLEVPEQPGPVQDALHIRKEAAFYCTVKNPLKAGTVSARTGARVGLSGSKAHPEKVHYPEDLQAHFTGTRVSQLKFASLVPTSFLDIERTELLFVAVTEDIKEKLGSIGEELEEEEHLLELADELKYGKHTGVKIFEDLHITPVLMSNLKTFS